MMMIIEKHHGISRSSLLPFCLLLILVMTYGSPVVSAAGEDSTIPWQMFRNNPLHTGQSQYPGARVGALKWKF
ncbi:MAG: hypothetical protein J3T61_10575, partial [Candidatus Brocadiales bacterium]|nr:hypothetical protein [Candidatus Bathyanammoxibius sp.]